MKYIQLAFVAVAFVGLGGALWADPPARVGRLSFLQGTVSFAAGPGEKFESAKSNYPLTAGNLLSTGDQSRADVHIGSTAIHLAADSEVSFDALDDQTVQLRIDRGSASVRLRQLDEGQTFQIDIQTANISLVEPGSYRVDQNADGEAVLTTREGQAEVTGGQTTFQVQSGQTATIPASGPDAHRITSAQPPDKWDQWVATRDNKEDQVASTKYVSREMDGVEDLDNYGNWQIVDGYGPVWYPLGVAAGWAPYTLGEWSWCAPWGWSWVSYEPWGFAPFHYGRWARFGGAWGWIPGPIVGRPCYAPGLVTWEGGRPGFGRWSPLGPRQPFHPWYHASNAYFRAVNGGGMHFVNRPFYRSGEVGSFHRPWYNGRESGFTQGPRFSSHLGAQGYGHSVFHRDFGGGFTHGGLNQGFGGAFSHGFGGGFSRGSNWSGGRR